MDKEEFAKLVDIVLATSANPPAELFANGYDDWHCRARLAHFLSMPEINKLPQAKELFISVKDVEPDEADSQDIEEKVYAMQHLSQLEKDEEDYEKMDRTADLPADGVQYDAGQRAGDRFRRCA